MTHEPECSCRFDDCTSGSCQQCCCRVLRAAYQRGREDAAKAVLALLPAGHVDGSKWLERELAIAAARGGERG